MESTNTVACTQKILAITTFFIHIEVKRTYIRKIPAGEEGIRKKRRQEKGHQKRDIRKKGAREKTASEKKVSRKRTSGKKDVRKKAVRKK